MLLNSLKKNSPNAPKNITLLGSCFTNFTVNCHLIEKSKIKKIAIEVQTSVLQQRSDIIVDLLNDLTPNQDIVKYYLNKKEDGGKKIIIQGKEVSYSKWFAKHLMQKIDEAKNIKNDLPDVIVMDSLCDIRHNLYKHVKEKWKVLFGKMLFKDPQIITKFKNTFEFTGLITSDETANNVKNIFDYFFKKNPSVKLIYIYFPISTKYLGQRWFDRGQNIKNAVLELKSMIPYDNLIDIEIPFDIIKPIDDSSHPNYSTEIWNHFYPETYEYCSEKIFKYIDI